MLLLKHRLSHLFFFLILPFLLSVLFFCPHVLGGSTDLPKRGQMVIISKTPKNGSWPIELRVSLFVEASRRTLWRVLTDYNNLDEFVPHLKKSAITARRGNKVYLEQKFRHLLLTMHLDLEVKEEPPHRAVFERYGGNMKMYTGQWQLEQVSPRSTIFTLEVRAKPKFFVPQKVMMWILKNELPKGLMAMRKRALENTGQLEPNYSIEVVSLRGF